MEARWGALPAKCPNLIIVEMSKIAISRSQMQAAIEAAAADHMQKDEVEAFMDKKVYDANVDRLYAALIDGSYVGLLTYRDMVKTNNNGKVRHIKMPSFVTRSYQWLWLMLIRPIYHPVDTGFAYNCKEGFGMTAKDKNKSLLHALKHLYYDESHLHFAVVIDQRRCYEFVTPKVFRSQMKYLTRDTWLIDFGINVCFVNGKLPIGTPTSPMAHHIVMHRFDKFAASMGYHCRYADDNLIAVETKEEAQRVKWRVKNFWWYELHIRAKRHTARVQPLDDMPLDFCGYIPHRGSIGRAKGYVSVRAGTIDRAWKATDRNWGCYFGILMHADCYALMTRIEKEMKLRELTQKIKIDRALDAPNIGMKELTGQEFTVYDYDMRKDGQGNYNWIKLLIGIPQEDGRVLAREVHGNYSGIITFIAKAQELYGKKNLLPLEDVVIENQCGYIFKDSTNQIQYIK